MERRCCIRLLLIIGGILAMPAAHADDARAPATRAELLDPVWIEGALAELGIDRLIKEYDSHTDPLVQRVQDALVLSRWFLQLHPEELRSQLQARLISSTEEELQVFQELPADRVRARATRASMNQAGDGLVGTYQLCRQPGNFVVSPDGTLLAMHAHRRDRANQRYTDGIELHNGLTGDLIAYVAESDEFRLPIALSPSRRMLIAVEKHSGLLFAWDLSTNQELWRVKIFDDDFPRTVVGAFSPDESKVAVTTRGSHAVYEAGTGNLISSLELDEGAEVVEVAFLNEEQLAGCVRGGNLHIWNAATGAAAAEHEIAAVRLSDDGRMALALDEKPDGEGRSVLNAVAIHETLTGALIREISVDEQIELQNHPFDPVRSCDFDPEGEHVFLAAYQPDGPIVAFNLASGEVAGRIPQGMSVSLYMRPITGLRALTSSFDDLVHVWDLNRPGERRVTEQPGRITLVDMTADGRFGVTNARAEGEVHLWDLDTGATLGVFKLNPPSPYMGSLCISDDAGIILAHYGETVFRVDPAAGTVETLLESPFGEGQDINLLRMSGDGTAAVAVGRESALVFEPSTGANLLTTKGGRTADISQDGNVILAGERIINRTTGDETVFESFNRFNAELCDDGSRAAAYSLTQGYTVWNISTRSPLEGAAEERKYDAVATADCDFSTDGRILICGDVNGQLAVYDTQDRKRLATLAIDDSSIPKIAISADGSSIFLTTHMGRLHHYRLENLPGSTDTE